MSEYILNVPDYVPPFDPAVRAASLGEEIVRCRDCARATVGTTFNGDRMLVCRRFQTFNHETTPDGFCAWGERRDA